MYVRSRQIKGERHNLWKEFFRHNLESMPDMSISFVFPILGFHTITELASDMRNPKMGKALDSFPLVPILFP